MDRFQEKISSAKKEREVDCVEDVWQMGKSLIWTTSGVHEEQYWVTV